MATLHHTTKRRNDGESHILLVTGFMALKSSELLSNYLGNFFTNVRYYLFTGGINNMHIITIFYITLHNDRQLIFIYLHPLCEYVFFKRDSDVVLKKNLYNFRLVSKGI